jgi:hypothetical protein
MCMLQPTKGERRHAQERGANKKAGRAPTARIDLAIEAHKEWKSEIKLAIEGLPPRTLSVPLRPVPHVTLTEKG